MTPRWRLSSLTMSTCVAWAPLCFAGSETSPNRMGCIVSVGDEDSYSLATSAALDCLGKADRTAASIDVVISCSITKFRGGLTQWLEPSMSSLLPARSGRQTR